MPAQQPRAVMEELRKLQAWKSISPSPTPELGSEMVQFFKHSVAKRQTKFSKISECWVGMIPAALCEHCALESFVRGQLTVIVDSSSHLYELKQLLLAGLQKEILNACKSTGLRKIQLKAGRWYEGDALRDRRIKF